MATWLHEAWSVLRAPQQRTGARPAGRRGQVTRGLSLSFLSCETKGSDLQGRGVSKVCLLPPRRDRVPNTDGKPPFQWPLSETVHPGGASGEGVRGGAGERIRATGHWGHR